METNPKNMTNEELATALEDWVESVTMSAEWGYPLMEEAASRLRNSIPKPDVEVITLDTDTFYERDFLNVNGNIIFDNQTYDYWMEDVATKLRNALEGQKK